MLGVVVGKLAEVMINFVHGVFILHLHGVPSVKATALKMFFTEKKIGNFKRLTYTNSQAPMLFGVSTLGADIPTYKPTKKLTLKCNKISNGLVCRLCRLWSGLWAQRISNIYVNILWSSCAGRFSSGCALITRSHLQVIRFDSGWIFTIPIHLFCIIQYTWFIHIYTWHKHIVSNM